MRDSTSFPWLPVQGLCTAVRGSSRIRQDAFENNPRRVRRSDSRGARIPIPAGSGKDGQHTRPVEHSDDAAFIRGTEPVAANPGQVVALSSRAFLVRFCLPKRNLQEAKIDEDLAATALSPEESVETSSAHNP